MSFSQDGSNVYTFVEEWIVHCFDNLLGQLTSLDGYRQPFRNVTIRTALRSTNRHNGTLPITDPSQPRQPISPATVQRHTPRMQRVPQPARPDRRTDRMVAEPTFRRRPDLTPGQQDDQALLQVQPVAGIVDSETAEREPVP